MVIDRYDLSDLSRDPAIDMIERYHYCSRWGVAPYPSYDAQTKEWKEFERTLDSCKEKYMKYKKA